MKKREIWIFVRGGLVTEVKSTNHALKVHLIDYDNLEVSDEDKEEFQKQEQLSENEFIVF